MRERETSRRVRPMSVLGLLLVGGLTQCNTYTSDLLLAPVEAEGPTDREDDDVGVPVPAEDDDLAEPEPAPSIAPEPAPEPQVLPSDPVVTPDPTGPVSTGGAGATPAMTTPPQGTGGALPIGGSPALPAGAGGTGALAAGGTTASGGVSPEPSPEPEPEPAAGAGGAVVVPMVDPNLIENFEDGNVTLLANQGRRGFWFTDGAEEGTISDFSVEAVDPPNAELPDSTRAMHVMASEFPTDSWATAGVELNSGAVYDGASGFEGIQFWARHGGTGSVWFSFRVPTESTNADDDHFGVLIELDEVWTRYRVPFDDTLQQQGFGEPQTFDPAELMELQFAMAPGETGFDIWIDDVEFY